jgi:hypothetical protein
VGDDGRVTVNCIVEHLDEWALAALPSVWKSDIRGASRFMCRHGAAVLGMYGANTLANHR